MAMKRDISAAKSTNDAACCIIPPEELWPQIQAIRAEYDKSYTRWMPHINLLWPFFPNGWFYQAKEMLTASEQFKAIKPFKVQLTTFHFTAGSKYLYLGVVEPSSQPATTKGPKKKQAVATPSNMERLQAAVQKVFPTMVGDNNKVPHMTVGQIPQDQIKEKAKELQATWTTIEFEVKQIHFIYRTTEMMEVVETIELGQ